MKIADILTAKELGQYLRRSDSTIYKLASDGELPGLKIRDSWRFDLEEVIKVVKKAKRGRALAEGAAGKRDERKGGIVR